MYTENIQEMHSYQFAAQYSTIFSSFLVNAVTLFIERNNPGYVNYFLEELKQFSYSPSSIYFKMHVNFFEGIISNNETQVRKVVNWFEEMDYKEKSRKLESFYFQNLKQTNNLKM
jgi:Rgg/GadR/MutR family transcriptional activator